MCYLVLTLTIGNLMPIKKTKILIACTPEFLTLTGTFFKNFYVIALPPFV